jgi:hypothetical protein
MEEPWQDVRYALRLLRRSAGFSAIAIGTLALGVGANTAIFSVINAVFLRPLPYPHPERIVEFQTMVDGQDNGSAFEGRTYFQLKDHLRSYEALASYMGGGGVNLVLPGQSENLSTNRVTSQYFAALGVPPALGRAFTGQEELQAAVTW